MDKELTVVAHRNTFGICPHCGKPMKLLVSHYDAYDTLPSGTPTKLLGSRVVKQMVCMCGFHMRMKDTIDGLIPEGLKSGVTPQFEVEKTNPIGVVEE